MSNKKHKCCTNTYFYSSESEFPNKGKEDILYVDKSSGISYIWDIENTKYLQQSSGMNTVKSVNDLRSLLPTSTDNNVYVLGHYEDIPGVGGGIFWWDEASNEEDNNGTVIKVSGVNSGRWKRSYSGDVKLEWFGVVYDDPSYAAINSEVINNVLNINEPVIIEGEVFLSPNGSNVTAEHIVIKGSTDKSKIIVTTGGYWFTPTNCKSISISDLSIESNNGLFRLLNRPSGSIYWDSITIKNSIFEGSVTLRSRNLDDNIKNYIGDILITKNIFNNSTHNFFSFTGIDFKTIVIDNNKVRNFLHNFIYIVSENKSKEIGQVFIRDNIAINDLSTYVSGGAEAYYVFALVIANKCTYTGNHVEGMKSVVNKALYDLYTTTNITEYRNNTFINNMNFFDRGGRGKTLIQPKGTNKYICQNSTFLVDEEYMVEFINSVPQYNLSIDDCYVSICSGAPIVEGRDYLEISGNNIDVFVILGGNPTIDKKDTVIINNNIRCKKFKSDRYFIAISSTDDMNRTFKLSDNSIYIEDIGNTYSLVGVLNLENAPDIDSIDVEIENNLIKGNIGNILENLDSAGRIHINNNKIEVLGDGFVGITDNCSSEVLIAKNNVIKSKSSNRMFWKSSFNTFEVDSQLLIGSGNSLDSLGMSMSGKSIDYYQNKEIHIRIKGEAPVILNIDFNQRVSGMTTYLEYTNPITNDFKSHNITNVLNAISEDLYNIKNSVGNTIGKLKLRINTNGFAYLDIQNLPSDTNIRVIESGN